MKRMLQMLLLSVAIVFAMPACKSPQLESGGAYAPLDVSGNALVRPDPQFFIVESAYALAYSTIDATFEFERNNRALLWQLSPQVKRGLDRVRVEAVKVRNEYARTRAAYLANPVPANLSQLQTVLAKIQQISAAAVAVLPKAQPVAPKIEAPQQ